MVKSKYIAISKDGAELGPRTPLDISIELDAKEEDEGETLSVTKMQVGKFQNADGKKDEGYKTCGN